MGTSRRFELKKERDKKQLAGIMALNLDSHCFPFAFIFFPMQTLNEFDI